MFYNWLGSSRKRMFRWYLFTYTFSVFFMILWGIYTMIYAYNQFSTKDQSAISLVGGLIGIITLFSIKKDTIRGWAVRHTWTLAFLGSMIDGVTEYFLLVDPIMKFICDGFATYLWFEIWAIQGEERVQPILNKKAKTRIQFGLNQSICGRGSVVAAALFVLFVPTIPIEWVVYMSMGTCCFSYFLSATRFVAMDRYIERKNLQYPYLTKTEDEEDDDEDDD